MNVKMPTILSSSFCCCCLHSSRCKFKKGIISKFTCWCTYVYHLESKPWLKWLSDTHLLTNTLNLNTLVLGLLKSLIEDKITHDVTWNMSFIWLHPRGMGVFLSICDLMLVPVCLSEVAKRWWKDRNRQILRNYQIFLKWGEREDKRYDLWQRQRSVTRVCNGGQLKVSNWRRQKREKWTNQRRWRRMKG